MNGDDEPLSEEDVQALTVAENWAARKRSKEAAKADVIPDVLSLDLLPEARLLFDFAKRLQSLHQELRERSSPKSNRSATIREEREQVAMRLNAIASKYTCFNAVMPLSPVQDNCEVGLVGIGRDGEENDENEIGFWFTQTLLELLQNERLDCIRQCDCCHYWFYAIRTEQKFCTPKCRKAFFESRSDVRESRNAARRQRNRNVIYREKKRLLLVLREGTKGRR